jgi:glycine dehydrogenase subunit 1
MRYLPHTPQEISSMLEAIGVPSTSALFDSIPRDVQLGRPLAVPLGLDEATLMAHLDALAAKNRATTMLSFLGAGAYDHHVPPAVDQLLLRSEFYTAYTPYQPEVAQGTLQTIFEFQTIVSELFGLPVANASMYDGASATAEAVLMARRLTKRSRVLLSGGLHPEYAETVRTYVQGLPGGAAEIETLPLGEGGEADVAALSRKLEGAPVACVVVGYPDVFGGVADLRVIAEAVHAAGARLVTVTMEPHALALIESPGALGADIAVGEGQPLGLPPQNGGPGCGLFACRDGREYMMQIPGRLCGETVDKNGERGYVLTLSTREQHIRREKATSNICTNHALCALAVTIRMCLLGKQGFVLVAKQCLAKAEYLKREVLARSKGGWELPYRTPTFNEMVLRRKAGPVAPVLARLAEVGILGGVDLGRWDAAWSRDLLVAVTERHSRADIDRLVSALVAE